MFFLFNLCFVISFSQEINKTEDLYIYVDNSSFVIDDLGYHAYFNIKSNDVRFKHDTYLFKIESPSLEREKLIDLGEIKTKDMIDFLNPKLVFKDLSNCELHLKLSLAKRIYIVTSLPSSNINNIKSDKYIVWYVNYDGTLKDVIFTNMTSKNLLEE